MDRELIKEALDAAHEAGHTLTSDNRELVKFLTELAAEHGDPHARVLRRMRALIDEVIAEHENKIESLTGELAAEEARVAEQRARGIESWSMIDTLRLRIDYYQRGLAFYRKR